MYQSVKIHEKSSVLLMRIENYIHEMPYKQREKIKKNIHNIRY